MLHCTAGNLDTKAEALRAFFSLPKSQGGRGWKNAGYHKVIDRLGKTTRFHEDKEIANGTLSWGGVRNANALHISYMGGLYEGHMTQVQIDRIKEQVLETLHYYPDIEILGHNQISNKGCPSFSVQKLLRSMGIPEENIYQKDRYGYAKKYGLPFAKHNNE